MPYIGESNLAEKAFSVYNHDPSVTSPEHFAIAEKSIKQYRCPADQRRIGSVPPVEDPRMPNPNWPEWGLTNYIGVSGTGYFNHSGCFHPKKIIALTDIPDGTSQTLLIGERPTQRYGIHLAWYTGWGRFIWPNAQLMPMSVVNANAQPPDSVCPTTRVGVFQTGRYDDPCSTGHFWSLHPGGANFAFADGSVRFLSYSAVSILDALATRNGREVVSID